ncbi:DEAD/DEAH box helicase family protein [Candidatus Pacearchaeota archaeon]|nr:DEAD/DEAH box helicase family protein [Candidatus Pacearchaeota archaeon]
MPSDWSLYEEKDGVEMLLQPLKFSNGKTQEDVVKEIIDAINSGNKIIFLRGMCGTGKSVIALNLAKALGRASIVVPVRNLQKQYEDDYTNKKFIKKENGEKLKIATIKGRQNFECQYIKDCVGNSGKRFEDIISGKADQIGNGHNNRIKYKNANILDFGRTSETFDRKKERRGITKDTSPDSSADNEFIPCKIEIKEKNREIIKEYIKEADRIDPERVKELSHVRRGSIAPACPYWSPIVPAHKDISLSDTGRIRTYRGLSDIHFMIYERKPGCRYYEQFKAYLDADVIIFNSQKYHVESLMNRKPATNVEIIDECDEFLDSFTNSKKINLGWLSMALNRLFFEDEKYEKIAKEVNALIKEMHQDTKIESSIKNNEILHIKDTPILNLINYFLETKFLDNADYDEENYAYDCDETAISFENFLDETYLSFEKEGNNIAVKLVTINLEKRLKEELIDKNKAVVFMSGTIHSEQVLKDIFGIDNFKIIEAETQIQGTITKKRTGMEFNCRYENFRNGGATRENYLKALARCIMEAPRPTLVHVNSFADLPDNNENAKLNLGIMTRERLQSIQNNDSEGRLVQEFKLRKTDILYSTRCNRGVDFPGDTCNSIVITKYPYPNIDSLFWKIFRKVKPQHYNKFYIDKATREFLQRLYRGLRKKDDHIFLLSPDIRVFYGV